MWAAWKLREIRDLRAISLREIALAVSEELGESEPYTVEGARGWRRGTKPRDYVIKALAKVLDCPEHILRDAAPGATTIPRKRRQVVHAKVRRVAR